MAKVINYILQTVYRYETEDGLQTQEIQTPVTLPWSPANEALAKREAHRGEYTIADDGREEPVAVQIKRLKNQLSATDYQVIKCAECQLLGQALPYDTAALHTQRQALRDRINALEGQL